MTLHKFLNKTIHAIEACEERPVYLRDNNVNLNEDFTIAKFTDPRDLREFAEKHRNIKTDDFSTISIYADHTTIWVHREMNLPDYKTVIEEAPF